MNLYETIGNYLSNNKKGILTTIVTKQGSGPRNVGAKMFVGEDGKIYGTIGGGNLEFSVYKEAMTHMNSHTPKLVHVSMASEDVLDKNMICGGNVDVFLEPVIKEYSEVYSQLGCMKKNGISGIIITQFNKKKFLKTLIEKKEDMFKFKTDGNILGSEINEYNKKKFQEQLHSSDLYINKEVLLEVFNPSPTLYIFGAGHISQFITKAAKMVGFHVVVIDDRGEFANKKRFPDADEILVEPVPSVFNKLKFTGDEFVVIVTRGHQFDADVLKASLKMNTRYVGMIGSRRKVKMIFNYMRECGFNEKTISKVYSPIGISINAETPQEIAVSIVAELIMVERGIKKQT